MSILKQNVSETQKRLVGNSLHVIVNNSRTTYVGNWNFEVIFWVSQTIGGLFFIIFQESVCNF